MYYLDGIRIHHDHLLSLLVFRFAHMYISMWSKSVLFPNHGYYT